MKSKIVSPPFVSLVPFVVPLQGLTQRSRGTQEAQGQVAGGDRVANVSKQAPTPGLERPPGYCDRVRTEEGYEQPMELPQL